jgi:hypothetical protein
MKTILIVIQMIFIQEIIQAFFTGKEEQAQKLLFQRLEKPLDLSVRLWMSDRGLDVADVQG